MQARKGVDELTGLDLRGRMLEKVQAYYNRTERRHSEVFLDESGNPMTSMVVGIGDGDGFGGTNKKYTHKVGDEGIKRLAKLLESLTREGDPRCRWGGDEFVFVIFGISREQAATKMRVIRERCRQGGTIALEGLVENPSDYDAPHINWTATVAGAYVPNPTSMDDFERARQVADGLLGAYKLSDRTVEPPLLTEVDPLAA